MLYYQFAAVHALNGERLAEVQKATAASLRVVGAELLAFNPEMTVIPEGSDVTHPSLIRFPDKAAFEAWAGSAEHKATGANRARSAEVRLVARFDGNEPA
jgi:uncharacterized protein (DUF1330 family)